MKSLFYLNLNNLHQQESAKTGLKFKNFLQEPPEGDNEKPTRSVLKEREGEKKGMRMEGEWKGRNGGRLEGGWFWWVPLRMLSVIDLQ